MWARFMLKKIARQIAQVLISMHAFIRTFNACFASCISCMQMVFCIMHVDSAARSDIAFLVWIIQSAFNLMDVRKDNVEQNRILWSNMLAGVLITISHALCVECCCCCWWWRCCCCSYLWMYMAWTQWNKWIQVIFYSIRSPIQLTPNTFVILHRIRRLLLRTVELLTKHT